MAGYWKVMGLSEKATSPAMGEWPARAPGPDEVVVRLRAAALNFADLLKARGETVAVSESSTGGLVSAALLAVPYLATVWPYRSVADADAATATRGWDRFLWLNQFTGFAVTLLLIWYALGA